MRYLLSLLVFLIICTVTFQKDAPPNKKELLKSMKLPPCKACRNLINSFNKVFAKTEKGKFEGGDTAWEEEKLGSYKKSEIRFVEIQEALCKDVDEGQDQCFSLAEMYDGYIEEWWFKEQDNHPDIFEWLCIKKLELCCPDLHYGPECLPCKVYPNQVCSNNGNCKGAGTRKGNGQCTCHDGYDGEFCEVCKLGYYQSYKDDNKMLCSKCHQSCKGGCTQAGNIGCLECAEGYFKDEKSGCLDVNECTAKKPVCQESQFCVNKDGSYKCLDCDRSCKGCTGDGPDMCKKCAKGYTLMNNMCVDEGEGSRNSFIKYTRYLTYFGLCVATCIILQRNVVLAAIVGLAVAIYISASEYMLATGAIYNMTNPIIDTESLSKLIW